MIDKAIRRIIFLFAIFSCSIYTVESYICEQETWLGITQKFECPRPGQPETHKWCCGSDDNRYCCEGILSDDDIDKIIDQLPTILGVIAGGVLLIIVLCIVCCCCCPFCLMYKRRNRGAVHQPPDAAMQPLQNQQPAPYPVQQGGYPGQQPMPYQTQAPYPTQAQPYPTQQPYPPQQPYPDQPPPYAEKQLPYNPGYGQ